MRLVNLFIQVLLLFWSFSSSAQTHYTSIFSFGDSFTDTGNFVIIGGPTTPGLLIINPPYGMTFFHHPTGRISDGRLAIDFIAEALGLPLLPPSMAANQSFRQGANFAVAGATALNRTFFVQDGDASVVTPYNISISDQLRWFDAMKPSLCNSPQACQEFFATALFVIGEFSWNDYTFMLKAGNKSVNEVRSRVPLVVGTICAAAEKLIGAGGKTVVVSGVSPLGCTPANLVSFASQDAAAYEPDTGCLKDPNLLSREHNSQLRQAMARLNGRHPGVRIVYADFYKPIVDFAAAPGRYGFDAADGGLRCCCGGGGGAGRYNFNFSAVCGMAGVSACADPSAFVNWDGIHLTEAANRRVADGWLRGPYAHPPILNS